MNAHTHTHAHAHTEAHTHTHTHTHQSQIRAIYIYVYYLLFDKEIAQVCVTTLALSRSFAVQYKSTISSTTTLIADVATGVEYFYFREQLQTVIKPRFYPRLCQFLMKIIPVIN